jgi:hypothetical protein
MKLLRKFLQVDEIDDWGEQYTLIGDRGAIVAKYASNKIIFPDAVLAERPFRKIAKNLIKRGYRLFDDNVEEWENSIEESWFMQHELKELELPKPEHANLLHIGWMVMDSSYTGFSCVCQNQKDFKIILKSAVPFLCPLCKKKRERWFSNGYDLEEWLIKDGFSLDSEYMKKWIIDLMQYDEEIVKEFFVEFLDKTHFDLDNRPYGYSIGSEILPRKDAENLIRLFEKDIQKVKGD